MGDAAEEHKACSIERALEIIGDRWTVLVLRDAFRGLHRFDDFGATSTSPARCWPTASAASSRRGARATPVLERPPGSSTTSRRWASTSRRRWSP